MSVDPEILAIFQHKVEQIPHFVWVTEVRHIYTLCFLFDTLVIVIKVNAYCEVSDNFIANSWLTSDHSYSYLPKENKILDKKMVIKLKLEIFW